MLRPTDEYGERHGGLLKRLLTRGALLLVTAVVIGALAGWTKRVGAADHVVAPDTRLVAREMGSLEQQLQAVYDADVTVSRLFERETNLRIGFRFLRDLLEQFDHDMGLALVAYNRGPAKVAGIIANGGDPANGYAEAVMKGYQPLGTGEAQ